MGYEWHQSEPCVLSRGYKRDPLVEEQICSWIKLSKKELLYYAAIKDRDNCNYPRMETLIHFTRRAIKYEDNAAKEILLTEVFNRGKIIVWNTLKHHCTLNHSHIEDVAYDVLHDLIVNVMDLTEKHEFWEVNFISCVHKLISTKIGSSVKRWKMETHPNQYDDDEGNGSLEDGLRDDRNPEDIVLTKIQYDKLTFPHSLIVFLLEEGYTQEEIATIIGCSSRTVRNYIKSIRTLMQK